jgi:hypothetical protein
MAKLNPPVPVASSRFNDWISDLYRFLKPVADSWTPTITAGSGTFTSVAATSAQYRVTNGTCFWRVTVFITTNGTAAGSIKVTLPLEAKYAHVGNGRNTSSGKQLQTIGAAGDSFVLVVNYDNSYPGASGQNIELNGFYLIS